MRSILKTLILTPALVIAAGCKNDKPADPALNNDLSLAAQANPNARLDSISAAERMNAATPAPASNLRSSPAPVASAPARRSSTSSSTRRSASSSGSSAGSSSGSTVASEPRVVTKKNTKRDAAIGAAAGAIIGGAASKSVKGGIIGAAAGGILGGVIGNNVDIQKKRAP